LTLNARTPRSLGFRWPAEWERQQSVWLGWPHDASLWPVDLEPVWAAMADLVAELSAVQRVDLLVQNPQVRTFAERKISEGRKRRRAYDGDVRFHLIPTDDSWLRDSGPIFLNRSLGASSDQAAVDWVFNGWGKFEPFDVDNQVPGRIAEALNLPLFETGVVLEGGAIDGDGAGACLTTEQCLLNETRNPGMSKPQYERYLSDFLGVDRVVWLAGGLFNDHTDGHVDVVARYAGPSTVVAMWAEDRNDPSRAMLEENDRRLRAFDQPLRIVHLPTPDPVLFEGKRLAAGYANFVIANGLVIVPTYDCAADKEALRILSGVFPDRRVIGLSAVDVLKGGGAFHCLTQQQPATG
jgi:agmatine deiminase